MVTSAYNHCTWDAETGGSRVRWEPGLCGEFGTRNELSEYTDFISLRSIYSGENMGFCGRSAKSWDSFLTQVV